MKNHRKAWKYWALRILKRKCSRESYGTLSSHAVTLQRSAGTCGKQFIKPTIQMGSYIVRGTVTTIGQKIPTMFKFMLIKKKGIKEMAPSLGTSAVSTEDLGRVPSTHTAAYNNLHTVKGNLSSRQCREHMAMSVHSHEVPHYDYGNPVSKDHRTESAPILSARRSTLGKVASLSGF